MKKTLSSVTAAVALATLVSGNVQAQVTLEATRNITTGCSFGSPAAGTLGNSADMRTLSTELGGTRPSFTISVIGSATLSQTGGITWTRGTTALSGITTTQSLRTTATGATVQTLPATFTTSGARTFYLMVQGVHNTEFMNAGNYVASATFNCV